MEAIVWIYELSGASSMRRLTIGGHNRFPIWSPDGRRVAFQSDRDGDLAIFWQQADGTGTAERLTKPESGIGHVPESWSPDGKHMLFAARKTGETSLRVYSFEDKKTAPFANVQSVNLTSAMFSPDGQWVVYSSNATPDRSYRVYVQPFPATGTTYEIGVGIHPIWSPDGKELMFAPGQGRFGAVSVTTRPSFTFGNLATVQRTFSEPGPQVQRPYDIMPNGKLIAIVVSGATTQGGASPSQLHVVLNWLEELKQRVPSR